MKPRHPAIYVRISEDREGKSKGVKRQLEDCRALVASRSWPAAAEYNDNDISAWKQGTVRPAYQQLLSDIAEGVIDGVVVYDLDRLYRQPVELEEFVRVCDQAGVTELAAVTGDIDFASGDGLLMARIKGAVAAKESDDKSRRIKRKALELAQAGKIGGGGRRPFGFESDRKTIRHDEAVIVRELAQRVLAGESSRSLAIDLNKRQIPTTSGGKWAPGVLTKMLKRGRISGQREHNGEIVADAEWPAIISPQEGERLRALLNNPARRTNQRASKYLLAGMLRCEHCGAPLISRPRGDGARRYVCAKRPESDACGKLAILADGLERCIVESTIQRFEGPELVRALAARGGNDEDLHRQGVEAASTQLEELARFYAEQRISGAEWLAARAPIEDRLEQAKKALARSDGTSAISEFVGNGGALRAAWETLPFSRQRAILDAVLDHATIKPARPGLPRFDEERVQAEWKI